MPPRPRLGRPVLVVLCLSVAVLADTLVPAAGQRALAALDESAQATVALPVVCAAGFGETDPRADLVLEGVTLTDRGAIAVGFTGARQDEDLGRRRSAAIYDAGAGWIRMRTPSPGVDDGLVAVTAAGGETAWAVGFTTIKGQTTPLAMRWDGDAWRVDRPDRRAHWPRCSRT